MSKIKSNKDLFLKKENKTAYNNAYKALPGLQVFECMFYQIM